MIEGSADRPEPNLTTDGGVVKSPKRVGQDEDTALVQDPDTALTREQRAALALDVAWLAWRTEFRRRMIREGVLKHPWRSVFEADMIFSMVAVRWLENHPITLKELATHFQLFATEATVSRHIDDMEAAGTLRRIPDAKDRRRLLLVPTERLAEIGRTFLQARVDIARQHGFVFCPTEAIDHDEATCD
ncbi:MarR family protein [Bradyrhizobium sp. Rc3b]|nr:MULTISPECIES: MarR family transcriptional regulator [unclassified Bradyrhizobium]MBB4378435.1 hypothetical protein [Bradyrhizobium sp. SBR1B]SFM75038.1 MarR family protein [Bradyrhizobium sp. Rc3b]